MTDRDRLQQMIDRIGKEPRAVKFDENDHLVELNLAGLDLEELPEEVIAFVHVITLVLGEDFFDEEKARHIRLGNQLTSLPSKLGQLANLQTLSCDRQPTDQPAAGIRPTRQPAGPSRCSVIN